MGDHDSPIVERILRFVDAAIGPRRRRIHFDRAFHINGFVRPFVIGRMRSMLMPSRSHQTDSRDKLNRPFGEAKGTPLSKRIACGSPRSWNKRSNAVKANYS